MPLASAVGTKLPKFLISVCVCAQPCKTMSKGCLPSGMAVDGVYIQVGCCSMVSGVAFHSARAELAAAAVRVLVSKYRKKTDRIMSIPFLLRQLLGDVQVDRLGTLNASTSRSSNSHLSFSSASPKWGTELGSFACCVRHVGKGSWLQYRPF